VGGKWRIGSLLGQGGMGVVFEAEHVTLGRRVAVKFLHPLEADSADALERFMREARAAGLVDHPGIARVIDFSETDQGVPFLVMEHLQGKTLQDLLRADQPLSLGDGLAALMDVLETLRFIHARGIIHRDLKPANIFCDFSVRGGVRTKILDFGIARSFSVSDRLPDLTDRATVVGTPYYISPEQAKGDHPVGPATDLWSVGVMLYYILTGHRPFVGKSGVEVYAQVLMQPHTPPSAMNPALPAVADTILARALAKSPDERYQSAEHMLEDLQVLVDQLGDAGLARPGAAGADGGHHQALETLRASPQELGVGSLLTGVSSDAGRANAPEAGEGTARGRRRGVWLSAAAVALLATGAGAWLLAQSPDGSGGSVPSSATRDATSPSQGVAGASSAPDAQGDARAPGTAEPGAASASAPIATHGRTLRMVWTPYSDREALSREAKWVVRTVERASGRPVDLVMPDSYDEAISLVLRDAVDFGSLSPNSYVLAKERDPQLQLLGRHLIDGGAYYQALILTMQTSGITRLEQLRGKRLCYVDPASTSGYLYPRILLREAGVDPDRDLGGVRFAGEHTEALTELQQGRCDAAAVASSELARWARREGVRLGAVRILATSAPIPGDAVIMRHDLPQEDRDAVRRGVAGLIAATRAGEIPKDAVISGFRPAEDADYDPIRRAARERGATADDGPTATTAERSDAHADAD